MNKPAKVAGAETIEDVLNSLPKGLMLLRQPFPAHQISTLPKPYKKDSPKGKCNECGGYHGLPAVHLDYVGHAALTDRLLDADPNWSWEPAGFTSEGLPALDGNKGLWIKLTVCGVTRFGYGCADGKSGGDAMKEIIGDALRNAAMRFGAALDLWHKGDLHVEEDARHDPETGEIEEAFITQQQHDDIIALASEANVPEQQIKVAYKIDDLAKLPADKFERAVASLKRAIERAKEPVNA